MSVYQILIGIIVFIILGGVGYYLYTRKTKHDFVSNDEYKSSDSVKEGNLILFYVNWCPHSREALNKWNDIKSKYNNPDYTISFSETDCDKYSELADTYNVKEYPTIILVKNSKNYEYDANLSEDTLNIFINTVMKQ